MRELSNHQIDFLAETFFKTSEFAGWRQIADVLLKKGECIIPSISLGVRSGGVSNFIKKHEPPTGFVDCVLLKFDLEEFLKSELFKGSLEPYSTDISKRIAKLHNEINELSEQYKAIINLKNDTNKKAEIWISAEQLPEEDMKVRWRCKDGVEDVGFFYKSTNTFASFDLKSTSEITHWMPLEF